MLSYHLTLFLLWRQACSFFQVSKPSFHWPLRTLVELSPQRSPTNELALWKVVACFPRRNAQAPPSAGCVGCSPLGEKFGHRFLKIVYFFVLFIIPSQAFPCCCFSTSPPLDWTRCCDRQLDTQIGESAPLRRQARKIPCVDVDCCDSCSMWARSVHVAVWLPAGPLRSQANRINRTKNPPCLHVCLPATWIAFSRSQEASCGVAAVRWQTVNNKQSGCGIRIRVSSSHTTLNQMILLFHGAG